MFFVDGVDVLFRIAMAILRNNEAELLRCESIPAVYVSLENLPTRMWEADKLLQVCDGLYFSDCVIVLEPFFFMRLGSSRRNFGARSLTRKLLLDERDMSPR